MQATRTDYGALLQHYQGLADAMVALKLTPPPDFLSRVIRATDRWRAVDNDATAACQAAAKILQRLGERERAWDYLTTPVTLRPNEAAPWSSLAATLSQQADLELADRAYRAAAEAEPTDPQLLWAGRTTSSSSASTRRPSSSYARLRKEAGSRASRD